MLLAKIINEETKEVQIWNYLSHKKPDETYQMREVEYAYNGKPYLKGYAPKTPLPTDEEIRILRANLYKSEVDPLMAEYQRKKEFNSFDEGEEEELLEKIENAVKKIKEENPYNGGINE